MPTILGVRIDNLNKHDLENKVKDWLNSSGQSLLVSLNAEMILTAQKDQEFCEIINNSAGVFIDGSGPQIAVWFLQGEKLRRIPGVDFVYSLARICAENNKVLGLFGGDEKTVELTRENLQKLYPNLKIVGFANPRQMDYNGNIDGNDAAIDFFAKEKPDVLLMAYGAPKQEKWLSRNLPHLSSVKVAFGVGGAFDFISGYVRRAPKILRLVGLEWLWRLIVEPWRFRRVFRATVVFGWKVVGGKIKIMFILFKV